MANLWRRTTRPWRTKRGQQVMLKIEHLNKSFGGVVATSDVSIHFKTESLSAMAPAKQPSLI
ncbi:MAG: hypothetical protein RI904_322 [Pseudomonadota bacterium]